MQKKIAHGIFTWCSSERRSDRYGAFLLGDAPFSGPALATPTFDHDGASAFVGKRVRITAKVVTSRKSGHVGDLFLGIEPSQPDVGEVIDLGVGIFRQGSVDWAPRSPTMSLQPKDGRERFWFDPRKLYRLHDQTVDVFVEETKDDFSPVPDVENKKDPSEVISNGDASFQTKTAPISSRTRLKHKVEKIGDGLFVMTHPATAPKGESLSFDQSGSPSRYDRINEEED